MKLTELPFRNTKFIFPFSSTNSHLKPHFIKPFSSIRSNNNNNNNSPWLNNWSSSPLPVPRTGGGTTRTAVGGDGQTSATSRGSRTATTTRTTPGDGGPDGGGPGPTKTTAIDRIVLRLRNLGLGSDDEEEEEEVENGARSEMSLTGEEKLGDLLRRDWVRPDRMLVDDEDEETVLPWEREHGDQQRELEGVKKRTMKAPTLAELTLEDSELRRLRTLGTTLRERITIPKAGITAPVLEKIHDHWRKSELVRLKFHEVLARDMKTAHEIVQVG